MGLHSQGWLWIVTLALSKSTMLLCKKSRMTVHEKILFTMTAIVMVLAFLLMVLVAKDTMEG